MRLATAGIILTTSCALALPSIARAWGDEGHTIVGHIAYALITPAARKQVDALLKADHDQLTATDFPSRTTWADKWRDSDRPNGPRYNGTREWHFVDIEIPDGTLAVACFGHPPVAGGKPASQGVSNQCVVDKIKQFRTELADASTSQSEKILALKFLMHFVGDVHQPLHSAEKDKDRGGNGVPIVYGSTTSNLHSYWDTKLVTRFGYDAHVVADTLRTGITQAKITAWSKGEPDSWAMESFEQAKKVTYDFSGLQTKNVTIDGSPAVAYVMAQAYDDRAQPVVRMQLQKAGVRLAALLNEALSGH
jgi:nuclease S1